MEKHKLIHLILKDLEELNEIAGELRHSKELSRFELDIAASKSKLVAQEFEFLKELSLHKNNNGSSLQEPITVSNPIFSAPAMDEKAEEKLTAIEEEPKQEIQVPAAPSPQQEEANEQTQAAPEVQVAEETETPIAEKKEEVTPEPVTNSTSKEEKSEPTQLENLPEEEEEPAFTKTLGDNFVKGKSLNDLLLDGKTLDTKLSSSPINKLETAIGLNDRFQYIRELFQNNPTLFSQTVKEIDQAENLDEAVAYLNSNFKWKKTDTSVQFAQLVKRRFSN